MTAIQCFLLEETDRVRRWLRRYEMGRTPGIVKCQASGRGYHDAMVELDEISIPAGQVVQDRGDRPRHDDPRWPSSCACGYRFTHEDHYDVFLERLYFRADAGMVLTLRDAPEGAMWWAWWYSGDSIDSPLHKARGGGPHLVVRTPGGDWDIDAIATNGPGWERTGRAPLVTATPSILCRGYHGWLRDGLLVPC